MRSLIILFLLVVAIGSGLAAAASKPVILSSAPNPQLSQAAWAQIVARHNGGKTTEFTVAVHVTLGRVTGVQIVDPCGADLVEHEVRDWVLKKWSFEPFFGGDKVQPMAFNLAKKNLATKKDQELAVRRPLRNVDNHHGLFLSSPAPAALRCGLGAMRSKTPKPPVCR